MARISISEFQYAFAFFHKFMQLDENRGKSFAVPSLLEEGGDGELAGLDLKIGNEYFIQFKMPDRLTTLGAREIRNEWIERSFRPYFRFNVKNSPDSCQFNTLVKLADKEGRDKVFYVAPLFDYADNTRTDNEAFNDFWNASPNDAISKSCFIDFHQFVGDNPYEDEENDEHVVCYNQESVDNSYVYFLSEAKKVKSSKFRVSRSEKKIKLTNRLKSVAEAFDSYDTQVELRNWKIAQILDENIDKEPIQMLYAVQREIISRFNVFWIPQIIKG